MDIYKEWQKVNEEKFSTQTIKKEEIMNAISKESSLTINELKKRLKIKIYWALFFITLFIVWFIFSLSYPTVLPLIGILLACYSAGAAMLWMHYRKMDSQLDMTQDTLSTMKNNSELIKKALRYENYFGLVTFPIAIVCGFILDDLYAGQTIMEAITQHNFAVKFIACVVILVPLLHILSDNMNKSAYGSYMKRLDENIGKMENLV
jgi:hypothetical protein